MAFIRINGVEFSGSSIRVVNGKVIVDGNDVTPDAKEITISVDGNIETLQVDDCQALKVTGEVGRIKTLSGDVSVTGNIAGSVQTVSGDVDCEGSITGPVTTISGDIKSRK
jgi:hypothetical protein